MNKSLVTLAVLAVFAVSAPSFAVDSESAETSTKMQKDSNGNYSETDKASSKAADGTKTMDETKVKNDVSSNGATKKTVKTKHVQKKGLFHKKSTKTKDVTKTKADGTVETSLKKVVDGHTIEDTSTTTK